MDKTRLNPVPKSGEEFRKGVSSKREVAAPKTSAAMNQRHNSAPRS